MKKIVVCFLALLMLLSPIGHMLVLAVDDDVDTEEEEQLPEIIGTHVSLTEDFLVHFYFRLPEGAKFPYVYVDGDVCEAIETEEPAPAE